MQSIQANATSSLHLLSLFCINNNPSTHLTLTPSSSPFFTSLHLSPSSHRLHRHQPSSTINANAFSAEHEMLLAVREKRTEEAWKLFNRLKEEGVAPCRESVSRLVAQLSHQGSPTSLSRVQSVVAHLQKSNRFDDLDRDSLGILAVAMAKSGAARFSLSILRIMLANHLQPSVRVWSSVVSRLGKQLEDIPLALQIFKEICDILKHQHVSVCKSMEAKKPSTETLETETLEADSGRSTGEDGVLRGFVVEMMPDTGAFNAALNACANAGLVEQAELILAELPLFKVSPDVLTYNILIKLYARAERLDELESVLDQMVECRIQPDLTTFSSLVAAYVGLGDLQKAENIVQILQKGKNGQSDRTEEELRRIKTQGLIEENSTSFREKRTDLVGAIGEGSDLRKNEKKIESSIETCQEIWGRKFRPDVRMYTTLMKGYMRQGRVKDAIQVLIAMQHQQDLESLPNQVTFTTAIKACLSMGLMDEAQSILQEMAAQKVPANTVTYNTLLQGYCNASDMDGARALFDDMKKVGVPLDVVTYNTMINGCIEADDNLGALAFFQAMRGAGMAPTKVSYTTLMKAFGKSGQTQLVAKVFEVMRLDPRVRIDVIAWNTLIDSFCKAGLMDDAKNYVNMMKEQGVSPTAATYATIANGFSKIRKTGEVLLFWNEIRERTQLKGKAVELFKPDWALMDSLVDIFLRAGYFQKALEVVACMEENGIFADKTKFKRMFIELYSDLYTSKHASQRRRDRSADRRRAVEAFKFWVGLPNKYYESNWSP